mmetsp:Transcript_62441/g.103872  ORF Transcript_62441/g.103872 Transcript_62441/m.103872 type:complete len:244 (-) Transcript_62441:187-918(-)|eukprot:CAMPEP_0119315184 /NCGR_PEP_ID=MMETSP1333-20130426/34763_1 /TAXON_ID=418940 /ORGANISM="Scyphosphaera apsteinii, Strain RCC1455" /LENGTH=243 /DNA_ID=CAMNT_0007320455 /DNA_START=12 /DNA_END=743 /DNA_ORIENTATION=-
MAEQRDHQRAWENYYNQLRQHQQLLQQPPPPQPQQQQQQLRRDAQQHSLAHRSTADADQVVITGSRSRAERDDELRKRAISVEGPIESPPTAKKVKSVRVELHDCVWLLNGDGGERWSGRIVFDSDRRLKDFLICGYGEIDEETDLYALDLCSCSRNMEPSETGRVGGTECLTYETKHMVGGDRDMRQHFGRLTIELSDGLPPSESEDGCGAQQKRLSGHFDLEERGCEFDAIFSLYRVPGRC